MEYSNQITAVFFAILFSAASKSKWFYKKYVENSNDKKFANQVIKEPKNMCVFVIGSYPALVS